MPAKHGSDDEMPGILQQLCDPVTLTHCYTTDRQSDGPLAIKLFHSLNKSTQLQDYFITLLSHCVPCILM